MASQALLDQFWQALDNSKTFQSLTPEEQAELRQAYENVTDDQLMLALGELQKDADRIAAIEAENEANLKEQVALTQSLKETLKKIEKEEIKINNQTDQEESAKAAEAALEDLGVTGEKATTVKEKPKRKKFLGIF